MTVPDRTTFESAYAGQAPWDIGKPQKPFIDAADRITGSVLDAGCGTGDTALFLAGRGCKVTGIDFLDVPIQRAKQKATERGVQATFLVKDALTLKDWSERFDNVIDSGLFHVFSDQDRHHYVEGLATVLKPGGRLFLGCFSDSRSGLISRTCRSPRAGRNPGSSWCEDRDEFGGRVLSSSALTKPKKKSSVPVSHADLLAGLNVLRL